MEGLKVKASPPPKLAAPKSHHGPPSKDAALKREIAKATKGAGPPGAGAPPGGEPSKPPSKAAQFVKAHKLGIAGAIGGIAGAVYLYNMLNGSGSPSGPAAPTAGTQPAGGSSGGGSGTPGSAPPSTGGSPYSPPPSAQSSGGGSPYSPPPSAQSSGGSTGAQTVSRQTPAASPTYTFHAGSTVTTLPSQAELTLAHFPGATTALAGGNSGSSAPSTAQQARTVSQQGTAATVSRAGIYTPQKVAPQIRASSAASAPAYNPVTMQRNQQMARFGYSTIPTAQSRPASAQIASRSVPVPSGTQGHPGVRGATR